MKIKQEKHQFKPIVITLETREEAESFFSLVDKVDAQYFIVEKREYSVIRMLSDARINMLVNI